jgi:hypothetical protein
MSQSNQHSESAVIDFEEHNEDGNNGGNRSSGNGNSNEKSEFLISTFCDKECCL